jgi:hypothetical protein
MKLKDLLPIIIGVAVLAGIIILSASAKQENMLVGVQSIKSLQEATDCINLQGMDEISKCIGEKSILYIQLGCPHCETQKELFGEYYQNLNVVDCFYESDKCTNIRATPTWRIIK